MKKIIHIVTCIMFCYDFNSCHCKVGDEIESAGKPMEGNCPSCGYGL